MLQRRVVLQVSNSSTLGILGLRGFIHFWGTAGSGKTSLAVAIASSVSKHSKVEWINSDGKQSFISQLKKNVLAQKGHPTNILVTLTTGKHELVNEIHSLADRMSEVRLVVIDPITRVLDMAREDPTLWGRELVEDILPTLAGIIERFNIDIIITSECRFIEDSEYQAVHHSTISRWVDFDFHITRDRSGSFSHIQNTIESQMQETAVLRMDDSGVLNIIPKAFSCELSEGVS